MIKCKIIKGDSDPRVQDAYYVRDVVFTQEQGFPAEIDIDDYDKIAWHCIMYKGDDAIGTARLIPIDGIGKIGRVAIIKSFRGTRLGLQIMEILMEEADKQGLHKLALSAQVYAIPFYEKLGFVAFGEEYLEEGEPHIDMRK